MKSISESLLVARKQGGVFTAAQAVAEGWTARQIRRRLSSGRWSYVAGQAMGQPGPSRAGWTDFQLAMAATLTLTNSVVSHQTAAALHGFPLPKQGSAHVITDDRHKPCRNITIHRLRLDPGDMVAAVPSGLMLTGDRRTAIDLFALLPEDDALDLWAWVSSRKILDIPGLDSAVKRHRQWSGTSRLKTLARTVQDGAVSSAELRLHEVLRQAGITGWEADGPSRLHRPAPHLDRSSNPTLVCPHLNLSAGDQLRPDVTQLLGQIGAQIAEVASFRG